jgi:predicted small lipoprotein YifL
MTVCGRLVSRLCAITALAAALGVAGCGRKGGLDLPPAASAAAQQEATARPQEREDRSIGSDLRPSGARSNSRNLPPAPSPKRDLPIDFLLN